MGQHEDSYDPTPGQVMGSLAVPQNWPTLRLLVQYYRKWDPEFAADLVERLQRVCDEALSEVLGHESPKEIVPKVIVRQNTPFRGELISSAEATERKGYPHPGNVLHIPNGGDVYLQFGHPNEVGTNGCFTHDVIQALIDNLSVYQQAGHPLACPETERTIQALELAKGLILDRQTNRRDRGVSQTDRP